MFIILHGAVHWDSRAGVHSKTVHSNKFLPKSNQVLYGAERACIEQLEQQHQVKQTFAGQ